MKIDINGKKIFFDIEGPEYVTDNGAMVKLPTLILIHGSPGNSDHSVFKPAFSELRDVARILYLDLSGSGRSDDEPGNHFSLDQWADDLVALCDALDIEKPIVLGVSAGGFVAMAYGLRHPDHAAKLILASTQAYLDVERSVAEFGRLGGAEAEAAARTFLAERVDGKTSADFNQHCMPLYNTTPQPSRSTIIFRANLAQIFHDIGGIWHQMDFRSELHNIRVPTMVLAGDQDPITPLQDSLDIVKLLPDELTTFVMVEGAGHGPWRDKPEEVFASIRTFIESQSNC
ncbi:MAG: alpha/beta hydrolase [Pseudomonadales bacterium]|nr:alpha/beta hydrolase [Pseudomonadales bacterium]